MMRPADHQRIADIRARLEAIETEQRSLLEELVALEHRALQQPGLRDATVEMTSTGIAGTTSPATTHSSPADKIALFRRRFAGRRDVFPIRWENLKTGKSGYAPACYNEWKPGICHKPRVKCTECPHQAFVSLSDDIIRRHLRGSAGNSKSTEFVVGVYPLLPDNTCHFLAVDFDGEEWHADAIAFVETCTAMRIPVGLERSRSGAGGHVWLFFDDPIPARLARQLGSFILTETMNRRPEIGFASYDRFFPSQDLMPAGGFGNLIALPLQAHARKRGNTLFVDADLRPYEDQWAFLSSLTPLSRTTVENIVTNAEADGRIFGVRIPVEDDNADQPWLTPPSRRSIVTHIAEPLPQTVQVVVADGVYIDRSELPPTLVARLIRLAAFQNPEFFRAQAMRLPTYGKPRIISCAEIHPRHVALPRGCLDETIDLLSALGITSQLEDRREPGKPLDLQFLGELRPEQALAASALRPHDCGVLAAATAFGKTVVAASLIAARGCSTLILVHRRELLAQWVERLASFLSIDRSRIGVIGGGRRKPTGMIDVGVIQSFVRHGIVSDDIAGYGHLVVDECHHLSAASVELVARRSKARYVLGLSATIARRDGHHPIILMQCGPIRYRVEYKAHVRYSGMEHRVLVRDTAFHLPPAIGEQPRSITDVYRALVSDAQRNGLIIDDVRTAIAAGRSPLVLTERREHLDIFAEYLRDAGDAIVLRGGMKTSQRRAMHAALHTERDRPRIVLSTGRYLGEGFDDARLDTLFLAMPIAWKGTLAQYVGRLHREHQRKRDVVVYDYVDGLVPVLARMSAKRLTGYRALGYTISA